MFCVGLDLAWGRKNTSGGVVLHCDGEQVATVIDVQEALGDDDAILRWIDKWDTASQGILIGIDAPLLVPNETGRRPAEAEIGRRFAKFHAGAHPANRQLYGGQIRGEGLVAEFARRHIVHDPYLSAPCPHGVRRVMEVFPHPAHVILFGLARTLKYKAKPGRDYSQRWAAMTEYVRLLRGLEARVPSLALPIGWPPEDVTGTKGIALKRLEDSLDALTCAYVVLWYWWHGAGGGDVIGDMTDGYIVVPRKSEGEGTR